MTMPISHKIAIIDDSQKEIASLLTSLSKNGISFVYFTGQLDQLPDKPLSGLRIVFSDIDLVGGKDPKTKISALLGVLKRVIAPNNGPYIIIFWTKHLELVKTIKEEWDKIGFPPLDYLCMEKATCKNKDGTFSVKKISQKIKEQTQSFQAFSFYLEWENALAKTEENFIEKFHDIVPQDKNWSHNIYYLLYCMFCADAKEEDERYTTAEQFAIACRLFNKSFNNELDCCTTQLPFPDKLPCAPKGKKSPKQMIPSINQFLGIHKIESPVLISGKVLIARNDSLKKLIVDKLFKGRNIQGKDVTLVKMIVTPACDIANRKLLSNNKGHFLHRVVYAIILDASFVYTSTDNEDNILWYYQFGPFVWDKKIVRMHFHFGTLSSEFISDKNKASCFTIKQEIVFDIQSKIANHVNRLGNSLLKLK